MKKVFILLLSVLLFVPCFIRIDHVYAEPNGEYRLDVYTEECTYTYINGIPEGEHDLEEDYDLLVEFDENTLTYGINVYGDVTINHSRTGGDGPRGVFITDKALSIYGNGTLTINIKKSSPDTVFEVKQREGGFLTIGSDDPTQRLTINVICNSDYTITNPHSFRVFRSVFDCLIQNCNICILFFREL